MDTFIRLPAARRAGTRVVAGSLLAALLGLLATPTGVTAQLGAGVRATKLEPTTTVEAARVEFWAALDDYNNIFPIRATTRIKRALELDPEFGLARVIYGRNAPGLSAADRQREITEGIADAARASVPELLFAIGIRDMPTDRERARTVLRTTARLVPDDPYVGYTLALLGDNSGEQATAMRSLTERFPDFAPAYNILAYNLWRLGDRSGAVENAGKYMAKAASQPNSHDTYGEILQWAGRLDEAVAHYRKALELDPTFTAAAVGLAEAYQLQGKGEMARAAIMESLDRFPTPAARVTALRSIASSLLLDNNVKQAMIQLETAAAEAKAAGLGDQEVNIHITLAVLDAMFGNGKAVAPHLSAVPMTGDQAGSRHHMAGWSYAFAKQTDAARRELEAIAQSSATPEQKANWTAQINTVLALNQNQPREAIQALRTGETESPIARALMAIALHRSGEVGTARSLRDELVSNRVLNLANTADVVARQLVKRVN